MLRHIQVLSFHLSLFIYIVLVRNKVGTMIIRRKRGETDALGQAINYQYLLKGHLVCGFLLSYLSIFVSVVITRFIRDDTPVFRGENSR